MAWSQRFLLRGLVALLAASVAPWVSATSAISAPNAPVLKSPNPEQVVNQPEFRWGKVQGATEYEFQVAADSRFGHLVRTDRTPIPRITDTTTWPSGSYWWRVRVTEPFTTGWSKLGQFTRRWIVTGADGSGQEVARPDNVTVEGLTVEGVSGESAVQVAPNRFSISWEPVPDASGYEVAFVSEEGATTTCYTMQSVLTPNYEYELGSPIPVPKGNPFDELTAQPACDLVTEGSLIIRVRALDYTADERGQITSLWSDEARDESEPDPPQLLVKFTDDLVGASQASTAQITSPAPGSRYVDTPTLQWEPVRDATSYKVVIARDRDFTTILGTMRTKNTRWIPTFGWYPDDDVDRTYFWFVLACKGEICPSTTAAINRAGRYGWFKKLSLALNVDTHAAAPEPLPWLRFQWQPYTEAVAGANASLADSRASVPGILYYQVQIRLRGESEFKQETLVNSDLPVWQPDSLAFGQQFDWRVRYVRADNRAGPWSEVRKARTPAATPQRPARLTALRTSPSRVRLQWQRPASKYFPIDTYTVFYSTNQKRWKPLSQVRRTRAKFKVNPRTRYWFMVTASSRGGESVPSQVYVPRR
mgnify:CR=1 FL=1|jgi:hypothetical protein